MGFRPNFQGWRPAWYVSFPLKSISLNPVICNFLRFKFPANHISLHEGCPETFDFAQTVFKYSSGLHSVVELGSETAYKNCDLGTALDSKNTGDDVVKLSKVGTRYFACGTLGHCDQGMKMKITTVAGNAPSTPASASTTSGASAVQSFATFLLLAALSGISLLYLL